MLYEVNGKDYLNQNIPTQSSTPQTDISRYSITGTQPAPGGPQPVTGKQIDLRQALLGDISKQQQGLQQTAQKLGTPLTTEAKRVFAEKGVVLGAKPIAKKELASALRAQETAINDYIARAGLVDEMDISTAKTTLNNRINQVRLELSKKAMELQKRLERQKASAADKERAARLFGKMAGTIGGAIIGGVYGGPGGAALGATTGGTAGEQIGSGMGGM